MRGCLPPQYCLNFGPGLSRASFNNRFVSGCKLRPHGCSPHKPCRSSQDRVKTTSLPSSVFCSTPPPAVTALFAHVDQRNLVDLFVFVALMAFEVSVSLLSRGLPTIKDENYRQRRGSLASLGTCFRNTSCGVSALLNIP